MNDTKVLIEKIKEGIQEKKGKNIVIADLTKIEDTICKYLSGELSQPSKYYCRLNQRIHTKGC